MFYVTSDDITNHEKRFDLQKRYEGLRTIPGTRSYHSFIPDGAKLILKRISSDIVHDTHKFNTPSLSPKDVTIYQPGKYIACYYDDDWYVGLILECSMQHEDFNVKFMHRRGVNLQWANDTMCWVPFTKVICPISAQSVKGRSAHDYTLAKNDYDIIMKHINQ